MVAQAKPLILVVEDEKELAEMIAEHLELAGMIPQVFYSGGPALRFLQSNFCNLVLLDVNLPDMTGFEVFNNLMKQDTPPPVIFLTANSSETFKVKGLEMGGDDYVTKPFSVLELLARIRAVLRRAETAGDLRVTKNASIAREPFEFAQGRVSPERMEITFPDGETESIGRKELGVLLELYDKAGSVITRKELIHAVWGVHADVRSRSLDQYIVKIRNAYSRHGLSMPSFRTVHGVGYIYDPEDNRADSIADQSVELSDPA